MTQTRVQLSVPPEPLSRQRTSSQLPTCHPVNAADIESVSNLIIIGAGFLQIPLIETARSLGHQTFVFDQNHSAVGFEYADHKIVADTMDSELCRTRALELHKKYEIHGVITAGTDVSHTVACIAEDLNLPGIKPQDALAASNKVLMRTRLAAHNIPQPDFRAVWRFPDLHKALNDLPLPLVLKPARNMGARGVIKITDRKQALQAFKHARACSDSGELIVEEFMPGDELSLDALIWKDRHSQIQFRLTGIADRMIGGAPYFVEAGHILPSSQPVPIQKEAAILLYKAMLALGIECGAGKGDLMVTEHGVKICEVAARLSGGFMSSHTYPIHSGINLHARAIQIALGSQPDSLEPRHNRIAMERAIIGPAGKILKIEGVDAARKISGVETIYMMKAEGDILQPLQNNIGKVGHILINSQSKAEAENIAQQCLQLIQITCDDSYGLDWPMIANLARSKFNPEICWVCKACDGENCASSVPGMGAVGTMDSFRDNSRALAEIKIVPAYLRSQSKANAESMHSASNPDTGPTTIATNFFETAISAPIMIAPMTGAQTNLKGALTEFELAKVLLESSLAMESIAWLGDGASPEKYKIILKAIHEAGAPAVLICKPRADDDALLERFEAARVEGVLAVGMDIDAIQFRTMRLRTQATVARSTDQMSRLRSKISGQKFILKGIMHPDDARAALDIGVDAIVISNHGGRVLDHMPGTARVAHSILNAIEGRIPVFIDGGVRSGGDVFKFLALGCHAVLFGRPALIAAVGAGGRAVRYLLRTYAEELKGAMQLCGHRDLESISASSIRHFPSSD